MLPGILVWVTLMAAITLSFVRPIWIVYAVIVFDVYWLLRVMYYLPFLLIAWSRYRRALKINWQAKARECPGYEGRA